jgi:hypothetical protein
VEVPGFGVREERHQPLVLGDSRERLFGAILLLTLAAGVALIFVSASNGKRGNPRRTTKWSHYNEFFDKPDWRVGYIRPSTGKRVYRSGLTEGSARKAMRSLEKKFPGCKPFMEPHPRTRRN